MESISEAQDMGVVMTSATYEQVDSQAMTPSEPRSPMTTLQRLMQGVNPMQREPKGPDAWTQHKTFCRCVLCL